MAISDPPASQEKIQSLSILGIKPGSEERIGSSIRLQFNRQLSPGEQNLVGIRMIQHDRGGSVQNVKFAVRQEGSYLIIQPIKLDPGATYSISAQVDKSNAMKDYDHASASFVVPQNKKLIDIRPNYLRRGKEEIPIIYEVGDLAEDEDYKELRESAINNWQSTIDLKNQNQKDLHALKKATTADVEKFLDTSTLEKHLDGLAASPGNLTPAQQQRKAYLEQQIAIKKAVKDTITRNQVDLYKNKYPKNFQKHLDKERKMIHENPTKDPIVKSKDYYVQTQTERKRQELLGQRKYKNGKNADKLTKKLHKYGKEVNKNAWRMFARDFPDKARAYARTHNDPALQEALAWYERKLQTRLKRILKRGAPPTVSNNASAPSIKFLRRILPQRPITYTIDVVNNADEAINNGGVNFPHLPNFNSFRNMTKLFRGGSAAGEGAAAAGEGAALAGEGGIAIIGGWIVIAIIVAIIIIILIILVLIQVLGASNTNNSSNSATTVQTTQSNCITLSKIGPDQATPGTTLSYTLTIGYTCNGTGNITVVDQIPKGLTYRTGGTHDKKNNTVTWNLCNVSKNSQPSVNVILYLQKHPGDNNVNQITNTATAEITSCSVVTNPGANNDYVSPSSNNCNGKYTTDLQKLVDYGQTDWSKNYGDPNCDFNLSDFHKLLKKLDPKNADTWYYIIALGDPSHGGNGVGECGGDVNAWAPPVGVQASLDNQGAWGCFQMGSSKPPFQQPPAPGQNGVNDRGDVNWQVQSENAINYNKGQNDDFVYWATAIQAGKASGCQ